MKNLYVVRDKRAQTLFGPILYDNNPVPILRDVTEAVNRERGLLASNPEDFEVLWIGQIEEETGTITPIEPEIVSTALALKTASGGNRPQPVP